MGDFKGTVLVTRPKEQAQEFTSLLVSSQIRALHFPMIDIQPPDSWNDLDNAITRFHEYDGLIFTSINAVHFFFTRIFEKDLASENLPLCYAVGERTKKAIEEKGGSCTFIPDKYNGTDLVKVIHEVAGKKFLQPKSNIGREEIKTLVESAGGLVHQVNAYKTVIPSNVEIQKLESHLIEGWIDCIAFFSPSAVKNFSTIIPEFKQATILVAAIGNTTAATAASLGIRVDIIAPEATSESMANAIISRIQSDSPMDLDRQFITDDI